jgi:type IV secretion system protein VirB6
MYNFSEQLSEFAADMTEGVSLNKININPQTLFKGGMKALSVVGNAVDAKNQATNARQSIDKSAGRGDEKNEAQDKISSDVASSEAQDKVSRDGVSSEAQDKASSDGSSSEAQDKASSDGSSSEAQDKASSDGSSSEAQDKASSDGSSSEAQDKASSDGDKSSNASSEVDR